MRELSVDVESSTAESLFLRDQDGHEYRLPVTDGLRALIARGVDSAGADPVESAAVAPAADDAPFTDRTVDETVSLTPVSVLTPVPDVPETPETPGPSEESGEPEQAAPAAADSGAEAEGASGGSSPTRPRWGAASGGQERERGLPKPDPLFSNPLTMRPRDIQERIRAGASTQELADEMQVAFSRVEPYAHPVMLERERMATIAKQAHPVREDGPAKLTLWEVLAAAFGTRGHSLADATWDSYKEPGNAWVVRISWRAGLSDNYAEWVLRNHHSSSPTAEARDAVAADLTDPNFMQPVRALSPISRGERYDSGEDHDLEVVVGDAASFNDEDEAPRTGNNDADGQGAGELEAVPDSAAADSATEVTGDGEPREEPAGQTQPAKRRRKSVTPHWEDVLLGVRSNTKRPRS
ncbi:septation protein SepH [Corynebacterium guangdongense]|uniref:DUF3071 domain-containing protein n=1 Tax=Corynebacterium guangdongense TaxID=1783348 RepID=A0ABU1ZV31_9CORY|nr:septation protein SepH [Corynebacterium guangdongense]MDR7328789.1 hypothetical protein [Corynebacterium guangdongense]WJZ17364.1 hypothetical protein CGUA_03860 [Corynebacterium guangdongense]